MLNYEQRLRKQINEVIKKESDYNFSEFIWALREILHLPRSQVSNDLDIGYHTLVNYEIGNFREALPKELVKKIAIYYSIPYIIMKEKHEEWILEKSLETEEKRAKTKSKKIKIKLLCDILDKKYQEVS